jgi:hypothetical protein
VSVPDVDFHYSRHFVTFGCVGFSRHQKVDMVRTSEALAISRPFVNRNKRTECRRRNEIFLKRQVS